MRHGERLAHHNGATILFAVYNLMCKNNIFDLLAGTVRADQIRRSISV